MRRACARWAFDASARPPQIFEAMHGLVPGMMREFPATGPSLGPRPLDCGRLRGADGLPRPLRFQRASEGASLNAAIASERRTA